ncbi:hypothetical protein KY285_026386 [Solanum tuberosum]|nr:hypothetical protein KY285_026386 [Solanum tuberosum]
MGMSNNLEALTATFMVPSKDNPFRNKMYSSVSCFGIDVKLLAIRKKALTNEVASKSTDNTKNVPAGIHSRYTNNYFHGDG